MELYPYHFLQLLIPTVCTQKDVFVPKVLKFMPETASYAGTDMKMNGFHKYFPFKRIIILYVTG